MKKEKISGFTLIELLVSISIIGILSTLLLANYNAIRERSRDAQRKSDLKNIQTSLRIYYNDKSGFPASNSSHNILGCDGSACVWGSSWTSSGYVYMNKLPIDPQASDTTNYYYLSTNVEDYTLAACLESSSGNTCLTTTMSGWCPDGCRYVVKP